MERSWIITSLLLQIAVSPSISDIRVEDAQCYGPLGCFNGMQLIATDEYPYTPEEINLKIQLYTRVDREVPPSFIYTEAYKLNETTFDSQKPTKFIVHGFGGSCEKPWVGEMKDALLNKFDINIFCVDWKDGAKHPRYTKAASTTQIVGKMVALFIGDIDTIYEDIRERLHMIGFSLGAQICGNVGRHLPGISRITGLDPAGPIFGSLDDSKKLDKTDALFVDVIHTNGDTLLNGGLGYFEPSGHVDFYPNGGKNQLGCGNVITTTLTNFIKNILRSPPEEKTCNHKTAVKLFTESIPGTCVLNGFPCSTDWEGFQEGYCFDVTTAIPIGISADMDITRQGNFYLSIRAARPLCGTQLKSVIDVDDPNGKGRTFKGTVKVTFGDGTTYLKETFTLLSGFGTPKVSTRIFTVGKTVHQDIITIRYDQRGKINFGIFDRRYLKMNSLSLTDGVSGDTTTWVVNTPNQIIESGKNYRLQRVVN